MKQFDLYGEILSAIPYNIESNVLSDHEREVIADSVYDALHKKSIETDNVFNSENTSEYEKVKDNTPLHIQLSVLEDVMENQDIIIKSLQAFKDYVHKRLDEAGIEKNPNGEHSKKGCRVGDRLDIVLSKIITNDANKEMH